MMKYCLHCLLFLNISLPFNMPPTYSLFLLLPFRLLFLLAVVFSNFPEFQVGGEAIVFEHPGSAPHLFPTNSKVAESMDQSKSFFFLPISCITLKGFLLQHELDIIQCMMWLLTK